MYKNIEVNLGGETKRFIPRKGLNPYKEVDQFKEERSKMKYVRSKKEISKKS